LKKNNLAGNLNLYHHSKNAFIAYSPTVSKQNQTINIASTIYTEFTTVLTNSAPFEEFKVNAMVSQILLPFLICIESELWVAKNLGSTVMIKFDSATEYGIDDHSFFHNGEISDKSCFLVDSNSR